MLGKEKTPRPLFQFDLEKELMADANKMKTVMQTVESHIKEIKDLLRQGTPSEEFDQYGILLHGYAALQRVLTRIANKSKR